MNVRHDKIVKLLSKHGEASVQVLADSFSVSVMTIRRDLMLLEQAGRLMRTHGGAVLSRVGIVEFAFERKGKEYAAEKRAIALAVASLVQPGMSISLDSGTTTLEVAKAIAGIDSLTVLTSSLAIASALYVHENIELVLLGGRARTGSPDLTGWLTEENTRQFHVDLAIVGADGVNREGVFTTTVDVTRVCQAIMAGGEKTILVVDHSKLNRPSFARFATLKEIDHIITDASISPATRKWLSKHAGRVTYARPK
jgi:DeoR/GlpR family transcriptional regulator of sugar metabolism